MKEELNQSYFRSFPRYIIIALVLILKFSLTITGQKASIREEDRSILTYPYSDPNPVSVMGINSMVSPFYPYFVFDGYTDKGEKKEWKVITLENDFITVTVLPEVGGKVWGAVEKSKGKEFIYLNHVLKFRAIGIRGPWTSGGIEHNFGLDLGHAPWTASPVDYLLKMNADSSVSCIVGGIDLPSRTQWRVRINLPKDKAYFETNSIWYNPTPLHNAYLSWENAGFRASNDLQFYFPGNYYIGHDGDVRSWPVNEDGKILSLYRENNFGTHKSYHVSGFFTDWFGGYWNNDDFGFAHFAPYSDAPGKKIWIWSLARDGAIWEDLLTDSDGQYIEAQSGIKFNQANRESGYCSPYNQLSIRPYYTETKTENWMPVLKTKGITDASAAGTLNVFLSGDTLAIAICPNSAISDSLIVNLDNKIILARFINLRPLQFYRTDIPINGKLFTNIGVRVGKNLLSYKSGDNDIRIDRPNKSSENQDYNSTEHLFRLAEDMNAMRDYNQALICYLAILRREPTHARALYKVAELYYRRGDYKTGLDYARRILENDTYDGAANFIYGIIQRKLGELVKAEEALSIAARTMEFRSGSYIQIAEIKLQEKDFSNAAEYAKKALDYNRFNISAYQVLATCYRMLTDKAGSAKIIGDLLEIDPLNHYARFEEYLLNPSPENLAGFKLFIRNELPHETYIELALEYVKTGLENEAIKVLEEAPPYPTVFYWLAYLYRKSDPERSRKYLDNAIYISPYLVFPYRLETIPVLTWAIEKNDSWKTRYYLGLIYWNINCPEKAVELFESCGGNADYAPFYIDRAILFQNNKKDQYSPRNDFEKALKIAPEEWRTWHYFCNYLQSEGTFEEQLVCSEKAYHLFPTNPVIGIDYTKALINRANFRECIRVLEKLKILPQEGAHEGHDLYEAAYLSLAVERLEQKKYNEVLKYIDLSRKWPENLGAGRPYNPDERLQDYISSFCYSQIGDHKKAESLSKNIINYSLSNWSGDRDQSNIFIANQVFQESGRSNESTSEMEKWIHQQDSLSNWRISSGSSSLKARWLISKFSGKEADSEKLAKGLCSIPEETRFRLLLKAVDIIKFQRNTK